MVRQEQRHGIKQSSFVGREKQVHFPFLKITTQGPFKNAGLMLTDANQRRLSQQQIRWLIFRTLLSQVYKGFTWICVRGAAYHSPCNILDKTLVTS